MITSRKRVTVWLGLDEDDGPLPYEIHSEDDMLMIEACESGTSNEIEVLISPVLFPLITEVISQLQERQPK